MDVIVTGNIACNITIPVKNREWRETETAKKRAIMQRAFEGQDGMERGIARKRGFVVSFF
jgi:hypothetical protein